MSSPQPQFSQISYQVDSRIATIVLDRPAQLNAFTPQMGRELLSAFAAADGDDNVRAIVVTGSGRGFCAGADLQKGADSFQDDDSAVVDLLGDDAYLDGVVREWGGIVSLAVASCRKFTIAAVNGPAIGFGATLTLPMDVRLGGSKAKFGFVFTRLGLTPEAASSWFLPRIVGISKALEWVATGRILGAQEALDGGLVSQVVEDEALMDAAYALAREVADNAAPQSVAISRRLLWQGLGDDTPWPAHRLESQLLKHLGAGPNVAEGVRAISERRTPEFEAGIDEHHPTFMPNWLVRPEQR